MLAASKRKDTAPLRKVPSIAELLHQAALACFERRDSVKSDAVYARLTAVAKSLLELEKDAPLNV